MVNDDSNGMIRTDEFEWPVIDTEEQDRKVLSRLEKALEDDPGNSKKRQAFENANRLRSLIPRVRDLKWYVLLLPDFFTYLTWSEDGFSGCTMPYTTSDCANTIDTFEEMIDVAERRGVPEEVKLTVLSVLFDQLKDFLSGWTLETKSL